MAVVRRFVHGVVAIAGGATTEASFAPPHVLKDQLIRQYTNSPVNRNKPFEIPGNDCIMVVTFVRRKIIQMRRTHVMFFIITATDIDSYCKLGIFLFRKVPIGSKTAPLR